jgi:hypothetical protein
MLPPDIYAALLVAEERIGKLGGDGRPAAYRRPVRPSLIHRVRGLIRPGLFVSDERTIAPILRDYPYPAR